MNMTETAPSAVTGDRLPPFTVIVEWENAIDVEDEWAKRAMTSFQDELERAHDRMTQRPRILYLYDEGAVTAATIEGVIDEVAPELRKFADVEMVPTPGLTYYKLKNYGVALAKTDIVIMLDSDAGPQPGWIEGLLRHFDDPEMMAVGGFTVLGHEDFLSRTMALSWIFDLPSERKKTLKRRKINANNCAFRTDFMRSNPFPDLPAFKKQCGFWLRDIDARGFRWTRTDEAMTIHAPHPGYNFLAWRAWTTGTDRDFQGYHTVTNRRLGRLGFAFRFFASRLYRSWTRIATKGGEVGLPVWQRPFAMLVTLGFFGLALVGQIWSATTRSFGPLPESSDARRTPTAVAHG